MVEPLELQVKRKKLSPAAIQALEDALSLIFWYKDDLRKFLSRSLSNSNILATLNWGETKRNIVSAFVQRMIDDSHDFDLIEICCDICQMKDFSHLLQIEDGKLKAENAKRAVEQLRTFIDDFDGQKKRYEEILQRKKNAELKKQKVMGTSKKIKELKRIFIELSVLDNAQKKGFILEKLIYDLFEAFDLNPKASFKNQGEQIDGAFVLDNTDYLFEAKWHKKPIDRSSLAAFSAKVTSKLDNTLGLILSINGFSEEGIKAHQTNRSSILLMDGSDLMAVLEERIELQEMLRRKKRHASLTGEVFFPFSKFQSH